MKCPLGLVFRTNYIRTLKSIWSVKRNRDYIIERCIANSHNIKPIIVIDDNNLNSECYLINKTLDGFDEHHDIILCRQVESIGDYMLTKYNIQKSNLTIEEKEKACILNNIQNYMHKELSSKENKDFNNLLKKVK